MMTLRRLALPVRLFSAALVTTALAISPVTAQAGSWIFLPSQNSYTPPALSGTALAPRPSIGPFFTRPQGAAVSSSWRNLRSTINVRGRSVDNYNVWETWVQGNQQF